VNFAADESAARSFSKGDTRLFELVKQDPDDFGDSPLPKSNSVTKYWPGISYSKASLSWRLILPDADDFASDFVQEYNEHMQNLIKSGPPPRRPVVTVTN
jgi:hypothetical protein